MKINEIVLPMNQLLSDEDLFEISSQEYKDINSAGKTMFNRLDIQFFLTNHSVVRSTDPREKNNPIKYHEILKMLKQLIKQERAYLKAMSDGESFVAFNPDSLLNMAFICVVDHRIKQKILHVKTVMRKLNFKLGSGQRKITLKQRPVSENIIIENPKTLDNIKWFSMDDDWTDSYRLIKHIGQTISATHWASWGAMGTPWSNEMIGGGGTYMLRGSFGHVMLDATLMLNKKKIILTQISVENRGSGIGQKIMNAIKSYADSHWYSVAVWKVTNKDFFRKFDWLDQDGDSFEYTPNVSENVDGYWRLNL